jgi:hypothetical protein
MNWSTPRNMSASAASGPSSGKPHRVFDYRNPADRWNREAIASQTPDFRDLANSNGEQFLEFDYAE